MGISLWLVPQPGTSAMTALQDVIASLSTLHFSPSFSPHVTLASLPSCISLPEIRSCFSSTEPVTLTFEKICVGPTFYQSVFVGVHLSSQLSVLHEHVHKTLGVQAKTLYFPHLSLYYGDENKESIAQKLERDGVVQTLEGNRITIAGIGQFQAKEMWVVNCTGRPEEWSVVEKVVLSANAGGCA